MRLSATQSIFETTKGYLEWYLFSRSLKPRWRDKNNVAKYISHFVAQSVCSGVQRKLNGIKWGGKQRRLPGGGRSWAGWITLNGSVPPGWKKESGRISWGWKTTWTHAKGQGHSAGGKFAVEAAPPYWKWGSSSAAPAAGDAGSFIFSLEMLLRRAEF